VLNAIETAEQLERDIAFGDQIQREIDLLLAERTELASAIGLVEPPVRVPASRFKDFIADPGRLAERMSRPMPNKPYKQTRNGTLFHSWVESRFAQLHIAEANDSLDNQSDQFDQESIRALQNNFENSRWAKLKPLEIEREIQLTIGGNTFICKLDAVFATETGVEIIDWKTGKQPKSEEDAELRALQLALYRLAYSRFSGLPIEQISASFYFVADDVELKPARLLDESELLELWQRVFAK
jgi:DNA helicase-2/ATP-dependent DNA helicase PcrA